MTEAAAASLGVAAQLQFLFIYFVLSVSLGELAARVSGPPVAWFHSKVMSILKRKSGLSRGGVVGGGGGWGGD